MNRATLVLFAVAGGILGLFGLCSIAANYLTKTDMKFAFELASIITALAGGISAIIASIAAFIGIDTWKRQLKYGKYLESIWAVSVSIHKCKLSALNIHTTKLTSKQIDRAVDEYRDALGDLMRKCTTLDALYEKNVPIWATQVNLLNAESWNINQNEKIDKACKTLDKMHQKVQKLESNYQ